LAVDRNRCLQNHSRAERVIFLVDLRQLFCWQVFQDADLQTMVDLVN